MPHNNSSSELKQIAEVIQSDLIMMRPPSVASLKSYAMALLSPQQQGHADLLQAKDHLKLGLVEDFVAILKLAGKHDTNLHNGESYQVYIQRRLEDFRASENKEE